VDVPYANPGRLPTILGYVRSPLLATLPKLVERDHERARFVGQRLETESHVEGGCPVAYRVHDNGPDGNLVRGCQHAHERVSQQQRSDPTAVEVDVDGKPGNECNGNRKVLGHTPADSGAGLFVLDIANDSRVVTDDSPLSGGDNDERSCRVASLALAGGMAQPSVQRVLAAVECADVMGGRVVAGSLAARSGVRVTI